MNTGVLGFRENRKKGVAHRLLMCYLIGDGGSACPTSDSYFLSSDRTALLFLCRFPGIKRKEKNNADCKYETESIAEPQNAWKQSIWLSMFFCPGIPPG